MEKMCWACTELYDDTLDKCPICGEPWERPVKKVEAKPNVKPEVKKKGK